MKILGMYFILKSKLLRQDSKDMVKFELNHFQTNGYDHI